MENLFDFLYIPLDSGKRGAGQGIAWEKYHAARKRLVGTGG
jgi:hypothetical protein